MVLLAGLVMMPSTGTILSSMGLWVLPLRQEFQRSSVEIGGATFTFIMVGLLLGPVAGFLADRGLSIRRMVVAGLIVVAGGLFLFSQAQELWMLYAAFGLMAAGATMSGWILIMTVVCRWFVSRRATAIGLVYLVGALGPLILVPLIVYVLWMEGWQRSVFMAGGLALLIAAVAMAWLRNRPEDVGLLPNGANAALRQTSFSAFQAMRTRAFWLIALGDGLASMQILEITDDATSAGIPAATALASVAFYPVGGLVGDRFSKPAALACFTALQVLAWAALVYYGSVAALYLSVVSLGISTGGRTPIRVAILADYFGTASLATILGLSGLFVGLVILVGEPLGELLYITQGETVGFVALVGLTLLGALCFLKARPPEEPVRVATQAAPEQESEG